MNMIAQSIIVLFGLFSAFIIGLHQGEKNSDEGWIDSSKTKIPLIKGEQVFTVECIGGDE